MALTGILGALTALVIIPLKARPADKTARELKLEREVERLTSALNYWRDAYRAQEVETDRLRTANNRLHFAYVRQTMLAEGGMAQQAGQGAFARQFDGFCTCVPSRAQVFGNGHGLSAAD